MQLIEHPGAMPRRKSRTGVAVSLLVIAALAGSQVLYLGGKAQAMYLGRIRDLWR